MEKPDEDQRENREENNCRRTDFKVSLPGHEVVGRSLAAGYTRLSAGINLGWIRLEGLILTLAASWPLEAPLSPHTNTRENIGTGNARVPL